MKIRYQEDLGCADKEIFEYLIIVPETDFEERFLEQKVGTKVVDDELCLDLLMEISWSRERKELTLCLHTPIKAVEEQDL